MAHAPCLSTSTTGPVQNLLVKTRTFAINSQKKISICSQYARLFPPDSSDAGTPEPPPIVTQVHPAAWQDNLEDEPTIVRPKPKAKSPVKKEATSPDARPGRKRRKTAPAELDGLEDAHSQQLTKSTRKRRRVGAELAPPKDGPDTSSPPLTQPKKRATPRKRKTIGGSPPEKLEDDVETNEGQPKPRRKRKPKVVEPVVYDIPPVEQKITTFRGRLGYACLNTILRKAKPDPIFCSRTCRIDTIEKNGLDFVKNLGLQNTKDLYKLVEWNEANRIKFLRISSELFPFASHEKYGFDLAFADDVLKEVGDLAKRLGHRLTTHPGQFTQLVSPKPKVVENSIRELEYHNEILDRMGLNQDSVMIIHMGGVYGDKPAALERFRKVYTEQLSEKVKRRLVLENDELCYNLDDLLPISLALNIPIVVDYHHDWINPSSRPVGELIPIVNGVWKKKGMKVKQHLSEPRPGAVTVIEKRAHADRCHSLPEALPDDMDLMIEAKDKEQAVFHLYRIYGLADVIHENLRPEKPVEQQTLATDSRKSNRKKKKTIEERAGPEGGEERHEQDS